MTFHVDDTVGTIGIIIIAGVGILGGLYLAKSVSPFIFPFL